MPHNLGRRFGRFRFFGRMRHYLADMDKPRRALRDGDFRERQPTAHLL